MRDLAIVLPLYAVTIPLSFLAALLLNPLVLGEETARSLGAKIGFARVFTFLAVVVLCGTTVSLAGPIAFIGLIVPHLARPFSGADVRRLALGSFVLGSFLGLFADTLGRILLPSTELEAGVMMALIGGPALIILVRMKRGVRL